MEYKNILYVIENGIAIVKINRPKALNALNAETVRELNNLMQDISVDKTVKVFTIIRNKQHAIKYFRLTSEI